MPFSLSKSSGCPIGSTTSILHKIPFKVQITKNSVEGVYDVKFRSDLKGTFNIPFTINNSNLIEGKDFCEIKVEPIPEAFIIDKIASDEDEFICGKEVIFEFTIKDKYGNLAVTLKIKY